VILFCLIKNLARSGSAALRAERLCLSDCRIFEMLWPTRDDMRSVPTCGGSWVCCVHLRDVTQRYYWSIPSWSEPTRYHVVVLTSCDGRPGYNSRGWVLSASEKTLEPTGFLYQTTLNPKPAIFSHQRIQIPQYAFLPLAASRISAAAQFNRTASSPSN